MGRKPQPNPSAEALRLREWRKKNRKAKEPKAPKAEPTAEQIETAEAVARIKANAKYHGEWNDIYQRKILYRARRAIQTGETWLHPYDSKQNMTVEEAQEFIFWRNRWRAARLEKRSETPAAKYAREYRAKKKLAEQIEALERREKRKPLDRETLDMHERVGSSANLASAWERLDNIFAWLGKLHDFHPYLLLAISNFEKEVAALIDDPVAYPKRDLSLAGYVPRKRRKVASPEPAKIPVLNSYDMVPANEPIDYPKEWTEPAPVVEPVVDEPASDDGGVEVETDIVDETDEEEFSIGLDGERIRKCTAADIALINLLPAPNPHQKVFKPSANLKGTDMTASYTPLDMDEEEREASESFWQEQMKRGKVKF